MPFSIEISGTQANAGRASCPSCMRFSIKARAHRSFIEKRNCVAIALALLRERLLAADLSRLRTHRNRPRSSIIGASRSEAMRPTGRIRIAGIPLAATALRGNKLLEPYVFSRFRIAFLNSSNPSNYDYCYSRNKLAEDPTTVKTHQRSRLINGQDPSSYRTHQRSRLINGQDSPTVRTHQRSRV